MRYVSRSRCSSLVCRQTASVQQSTPSSSTAEYPAETSTGSYVVPSRMRSPYLPYYPYGLGSHIDRLSALRSLMSVCRTVIDPIGRTLEPLFVCSLPLTSQSYPPTDARVLIKLAQRLQAPATQLGGGPL